MTLERVSSTCVRAPRMLGEKVESSWGGWLYLDVRSPNARKCLELMIFFAELSRSSGSSAGHNMTFMTW